MKLVIAKIRTINGDRIARIALDYESEQEGIEDVTILDYTSNWEEGRKACEFWSQELNVKVFNNDIEYQI